MYYYLYKITNKINQKVYIGVHTTSNMEDGYMGSGKYLKRAIKKYGIENFEKEILQTFDNSEDMYNAEKLLVTEDFINSRSTYNLKIGGEGGFDYINSNPTKGMIKNRTDFGKNIKEMLKDPEFNFMFTSVRKKSYYKCENIKKRSVGIKNAIKKNGSGYFYGKTHSEETKKLMSNTHKERGNHKGIKNSQYGKIWIYSDIEKRSIKINKDEEIPIGWIKGRKVKF